MSLRLFEGFGVEIEWMIVDRESLAVRPIADRLLAAVSDSGAPESEVDLGAISWSNELTLHVVELKTTGPAPSLDGLADRFAEHARRIDDLLAPMGARLMPTAMHPLMDPVAETALWPFDSGPVYEAFDRVFDCRGHGWSNLQSMHINLPFDGDDEFAALHEATRRLLPILPALAASSPVVEGRPTGLLDNRLESYRHNCRRVPEVTGRVVPEPASSRDEYERAILGPMYDAIAPLDPGGVLRHEWLNARGAIARFDRGTVEVRLLDTQEHPGADLAVASLVVEAVRALADGRWSGPRDPAPIDVLEPVLLACMRDADRAPIGPDYLRLLGPVAGPPARPMSAGDLWRRIHAALLPDIPALAAPDRAGPLATILGRGPLARRILGRLGPDPARDAIRSTYAELCDCLAEGRSFDGA